MYAVTVAASGECAPFVVNAVARRLIDQWKNVNTDTSHRHRHGYAHAKNARGEWILCVCLGRLMMRSGTFVCTDSHTHDSTKAAFCVVINARLIYCTLQTTRDTPLENILRKMDIYSINIFELLIKIANEHDESTNRVKCVVAIVRTICWNSFTSAFPFFNVSDGAWSNPVLIRISKCGPIKWNRNLNKHLKLKKIALQKPGKSGFTNLAQLKEKKKTLAVMDVAQNSLDAKTNI